MNGVNQMFDQYHYSQCRLLEPLSDYELVQRVLQNRDAAAFELIMRRNNQKLYRIARSVVKNAQDAEDIVQDTYLTAFEKLAQFNGPTGLNSWLSKIALNKALTKTKRSGRVIAISELRSTSANMETGFETELDNFQSNDPGPEFHSQNAELRRVLEDAIDSLPVSFRTVFVLHKVEGFSIREISELLTINEQTVKTRLHRAKSKLRQRIGMTFENLAPSIHEFAGERCTKIVLSVLEALHRV